MTDIKLRLQKNPRVALSMVFLGVVFALGFFVPLIYSIDPFSIRTGPILAPPAFQFVCGTDHLGRDVLSGVMEAIRTAFFVGITTATISVTIGLFSGAFCAFAGGWADEILTKIVDFTLALPPFVLMILFIVSFGANLFNVIFFLSILGWVNTARIARSEVLKIKEEAFIDASRAIGEKDYRILLFEVLPNILPAIIVTATMEIPYYILSEASLSFFHLSDPSVMSFGNLLEIGGLYIRQGWWLIAFPGFFLFLMMLSFTVLGDGLNDLFRIGKEIGA